MWTTIGVLHKEGQLGVENISTFEQCYKRSVKVCFEAFSLSKLFQKFKDTICTLKSSTWIT